MMYFDIHDVRCALRDMKNTYEGTLTDEELAEASLQDDLGLDYSEFIELIFPK